MDVTDVIEEAFLHASDAHGAMWTGAQWEAFLTGLVATHLVPKEEAPLWRKCWRALSSGPLTMEGGSGVRYEHVKAWFVERGGMGKGRKEDAVQLGAQLTRDVELWGGMLRDAVKGGVVSRLVLDGAVEELLQEEKAWDEVVKVVERHFRSLRDASLVQSALVGAGGGPEARVLLYLGGVGGGERVGGVIRARASRLELSVMEIRLRFPAERRSDESEWGRGGRGPVDSRLVEFAARAYLRSTPELMGMGQDGVRGLLEAEAEEERGGGVGKQIVETWVGERKDISAEEAAEAALPFIVHVTPLPEPPVVGSLSASLSLHNLTAHTHLLLSPHFPDVCGSSGPHFVPTIGGIAGVGKGRRRGEVEDAGMCRYGVGECVEGVRLSALLKRGGPILESRALFKRITRAVLCALAAIETSCPCSILSQSQAQHLLHTASSHHASSSSSSQTLPPASLATLAHWGCLGSDHVFLTDGGDRVVLGEIPWGGSRESASEDMLEWAVKRRQVLGKSFALILLQLLNHLPPTPPTSSATSTPPNSSLFSSGVFLSSHIRTGLPIHITQGQGVAMWLPGSGWTVAVEEEGGDGRECVKALDPIHVPGPPPDYAHKEKMGKGEAREGEEGGAEGGEEEEDGEGDGGTATSSSSSTSPSSSCLIPLAAFFPGATTVSLVREGESVPSMVIPVCVHPDTPSSFLQALISTLWESDEKESGEMKWCETGGEGSGEESDAVYAVKQASSMLKSLIKPTHITPTPSHDKSLPIPLSAILNHPYFDPLPGTPPSSSPHIDVIERANAVEEGAANDEQVALDTASQKIAARARDLAQQMLQ